MFASDKKTISITKELNCICNVFRFKLLNHKSLTTEKKTDNNKQFSLLHSCKLIIASKTSEPKRNNLLF